MMRITTISAIIGAIALCAPLEAAQFVFKATLTGAEESPPNASTATGAITVVADDVLNTFAVTESWSGLSAPVTGAHIHCCAPIGTNAPVVVPFTNFPTATSGTYVNTFAPAGFATLLTGMQAGLAYANIHNALFSGGEIRGQLTAAPEPASWTLMTLGFGLIGATIRRRVHRPALV